MGLGQSSLSQAAAQIAEDVGQFDSKLLTEGELLNRALFPTEPESAEHLGTESDPGVARQLQRNAVALAQGAGAISTKRGLLAAGTLGQQAAIAVGRLVGQDTFDRDVDVEALVELGADSIIDSVVEGSLSSIPFVGSAATLLWDIGVSIFRANGSESRLPPMLRLDPAADNAETNRAVALLKDESVNDWTPLFLPTTRGFWGTTREEVSPARGSVETGTYTYKYARQPEDEYVEGVRRFGCAPGDLFYVDRGFQSRITKSNVTIPSNANSPKYRNFLQTGENPESLHRLAFPLSNWFPSLSALGRSVWSLIGARESTALFMVNASKVASEWDEFADAAAIFRAQMDEALGHRADNISKDYKRHVIARELGNFAAAFHTLRARDSKGKIRGLSQDELLAAVLDPAKRASSDAVGRQAVEHAERLEKRQRQAAKTPLNALVTKNAPALRNNAELREHFMRHRSMQLDAGKFDGVALDDVPDPVLRQRLEERHRRPDDGLPTTFASPDKVADLQAMRREFQASLKTIDRPLGFGGFGAEPDPDDRTGGGFGLAVAGLAVAGLAGGGALLYRRRRGRTA